MASHWANVAIVCCKKAKYYTVFTNHFGCHFYTTWSSQLSRNLHHTIRIEVNSPFVFSLLVEHTLSLTVQLYGSAHCSNSGRVDVEIFFKQNWPQIYKFNEYDGGIRGITGEILNYYCVLQWVFMDILIIAITICLSTRLFQLNEHMGQFAEMVKGEINLPRFRNFSQWFFFHFPGHSENVTWILAYTATMFCIDIDVDCESG